MHAQSSYVVGSLCHSIHLRIYTSGVVYIFLHFHTEDHTLHKKKKKTAFLDFLHSHLTVGLLRFNSLVQYMSLVTVPVLSLLIHSKIQN